MKTNKDCIANDSHIRITNPSRYSEYMPTLDGWRTIAILIVIFAHSSDSIKNVFGSIESNYIFEYMKILGLLGVKIFFGLSGFLITTKLISDEFKRGQISLKSFYIRRAFRILPASIVFLLTVAILSLSGIIQISLDRWLSTLFFFANYTSAEGTWYLGHFWSLAVEEHFYFLWPLAFIMLTTNRQRVSYVIGGVILLALWRAVDFKYQITGSSATIFWGRTDIQADYLMCGVLIALLYSDSVWKLRLQRFVALPAIWPTLVTAVFGIAIFKALDWKIAFSLLTVQAIAIPLAILGTVTRSTLIVGRVLESRVFRWVGRISYSLYLWQQLFLVWNVARVPKLSLIQSLPLNIFLTFGCATLSVILIEKPFINLGHRIANRLAPLPV